MLPGTWPSAFPGPTRQVRRVYRGGAGPVLFEVKRVRETVFCPAPLVLLSLSAVPEPQGSSPYLAAQKGQLLRLLCAADSTPPATLSWALEDRVLSWSHPWGPRTLALVLPGVKPGDSGRYTCRAENRLGSQSRSLDLSVQCECGQQGPGFWERGRGCWAGAGGGDPEI